MITFSKKKFFLAPLDSKHLTGLVLLTTFLFIFLLFNNVSFVSANGSYIEATGEIPVDDELNICGIDFSPSLWGFLTSPFNAALGTIISGVTFILKFVLKIIILSFGRILLFPASFGGFSLQPAVQTLWREVLNFANLGIILGIIAIAIATILRIEQYNWKRLLWKLLVVALLVNFSLVICGLFIDISNFFITYFLTAGGINNLWKIFNHIITKIACEFSGTPTAWNFTMGSLVSLILTVIFLSQFIGLLFIAAARIITIWLALILSPLAFISSAIPVLNKIYHAWRDHFTAALVNLPVIAFVIFIILIVLSNLSSYMKEENLGFENLLVYGILIILLMQAVLIVASQIGAKQMSTGYNWARGLTMAGLGMAGGWVGGNLVKAAIKSRHYERTAEALSRNTRLGPLLPAISSSMYRLKQGTVSAEYKKIKEQVESLRGHKPALESLFDSTTNSSVRMAILAAKAETGLDLRPNEEEFYLRIGGIRFAKSQEDRVITRTYPVFRPDNQRVPGQISLSELNERVLGALKNRKDAETINIRGNIRILQQRRPQDLTPFVTTLFRNIITVKEFSNLLRSIGESSDDRNQFINTINTALNIGQPGQPQTFNEWLKINNGELHRNILNPSVGERMLAGEVRRVFGIIP